MSSASADAGLSAGASVRRGWGAGGCRALRYSARGATHLHDELFERNRQAEAAREIYLGRDADRPVPAVEHQHLQRIGALDHAAVEVLSACFLLVELIKVRCFADWPPAQFPSCLEARRDV